MGEMRMASVDEPSPAMGVEKIDVDIDVENKSIGVFGTQLFQILTKSFVCKKIRL